MPARGLVKGMWGRKRAVAIGAIAAGALLVVVQASAGSSARGTPELQAAVSAAASIKGVGASLQGVVRTARVERDRAPLPRLARTSGVDVTASGVRVIVVPRSGAVAATKTRRCGSRRRRRAERGRARAGARAGRGSRGSRGRPCRRRSFGGRTCTLADVVTGEEIAAMNAAGYTNAGYDGTGVKIGIIDGGFAGYAARLGTELPASVTTAGLLRRRADDGDRARHRRWPRSSTRSRRVPSST